MNYKVKILEHLLDKYERSKHYYCDTAVNRRVILKMNRKEFPQYDIEKFELKEQIHSAVQELKQAGAVDFEWAKYEKGNILDSVWLNVEQIDRCYSLAGRTPKSDIVQDVLDRLQQTRKEIQTGWMVQFLETAIARIAETKDVPRSIPSDQDQLEMLLQTLRGIEDLDGDEILERIFSRKYLGGSKLFEQKIRSRLVTIIKEYLCNGEDVEAEEALELVGLQKTSEELLFYGSLVVDLHGKQLDFQDFCYGASMNSRMIREITIQDLSVKKVLTIENKANFVEMVNRGVDQETLVIYLAGFYSPIKREFLRKVYDFLQGKDVAFYHWGDIDLGGFQIFVLLRQMISELRPWKMGLEDLKAYRQYVDPIDHRYRKSLQRLLTRSEYSDFTEVIEYMIEEKIKLEQEALL